MPIYPSEELPVFDCLMCAKILNSKGGRFKTIKTEWRERIIDSDPLPPGVMAMECTGCGLLGIKYVGNTPKVNDGVSLD